MTSWSPWIILLVMLTINNVQETHQEIKIANVNFLTDDIVHTLQNTIDSYMNSATDLRCCVGTKFTKVSEITQSNGHYAVQGHCWYQSKAIYDFLLLINTNLPHILHRFQVMADYWSNFR